MAVGTSIVSIALNGQKIRPAKIIPTIIEMTRTSRLAVGRRPKRNQLPRKQGQPDCGTPTSRQRRLRPPTRFLRVRRKHQAKYLRQYRSEPGRAVAKRRSA